MRYLLTAIFLLVLAACGGGAPKDLTAHYAKPDGIAFTVEAAANGDARVTAGDQVMIRKGGVDYLVREDAKGRYAVRAADYVALLDSASGPATARPQPDYVTAAGDREGVAGIKGKIWRVHPRDVPSMPAIVAVVSDAPALAGLGDGVAMHSKLLIERNARSMGTPPGKLEQAMMALFDKGAVLRFGDVFRLERIEWKPVPADRFALPVVIDGSALRARLGAG
jgi:hypothetical protein